MIKFFKNKILGRKNKEEVNEDINIYAPCDCDVLKLEEVNDPAFSKKMLGDGFAILPHEDEFVSPVDGTLTTLFHTKHAFIFALKNGVEVMMHIGINSIDLSGKGIDALVEQGDKVKVGKPIVNVDIKTISKKIKSLHTPFVFDETKLGNYKINVVATGKVNKGDLIATLSN